MLNLGQKLRETQSVSVPGVNQRGFLIKTRYTYICFTWNIEDCYCYKYCKQIIYIVNHYKWHDVRGKSVTAHSVYSNSKASLCTPLFLKSLHNLPYSNGGAILYLSNKGDKHICHSEQIPISRYHLQIVWTDLQPTNKKNIVTFLGKNFCGRCFPAIDEKPFSVLYS